MYRMFSLDYYDAVLLNAEYHGDQVRKLEELRGLPNKEIVYVGIPYFDVMKEKFGTDTSDEAIYKAKIKSRVNGRISRNFEF